MGRGGCRGTRKKGYFYEAKTKSAPRGICLVRAFSPTHTQESSTCIYTFFVWRRSRSNNPSRPPSHQHPPYQRSFNIPACYEQLRALLNLVAVDRQQANCNSLHASRTVLLPLTLKNPPPRPNSTRPDPTLPCSARRTSLRTKRCTCGALPLGRSCGLGCMVSRGGRRWW